MKRHDTFGRLSHDDLIIASMSDATLLKLGERCYIAFINASDPDSDQTEGTTSEEGSTGKRRLRTKREADHENAPLEIQPAERWQVFSAHSAEIECGFRQRFEHSCDEFNIDRAFLALKNQASRAFEAVKRALNRKGDANDRSSEPKESFAQAFAAITQILDLRLYLPVASPSDLILFSVMINRLIIAQGFEVNGKSVGQLLAITMGNQLALESAREGFELDFRSISARFKEAGSSLQPLSWARAGSFLLKRSPLGWLNDLKGAATTSSGEEDGAGETTETVNADPVPDPD